MLASSHPNISTASWSFVLPEEKESSHAFSIELILHAHDAEGWEDPEDAEETFYMGVPLHKFGLPLKIMKQVVWYLQLLDSLTPDDVVPLCDHFGCRREAGVDDTWRVVCLLKLKWSMSSAPVPIVLDEKHAASPDEKKKSYDNPGLPLGDSDEDTENSDDLPILPEGDTAAGVPEQVHGP